MKTAASPRGFTLLELLIVIALITLLATLVISVARAVHTAQLEKKTRVNIEAMQTALQDYYITQQQYPFQTEPPTQQAKTMTAVADELVAKGQLSRKKADDNKLDGWGNDMLYLLYNYKQTPYPTTTYTAVSGLPAGNWSGRVNTLMSKNVLDWKSAHPVIGSAGADSTFGTDDDIYNDRSM